MKRAAPTAVKRPMPITSPDAPELDALCATLTSMASELDKSAAAWPARQLALCGQAGVFRWFISPEQAGAGWSDVDVCRGYLKLSAACLTTTFIITQRTGACQRIAASDNRLPQKRLLPALLDGSTFATVGISHLTTSRRHLARPVLEARPVEGGYLLNGFSPWVTGADHAQSIVIGATLPDGRQILAALPTDAVGVTTPDPPPLVGLSASHTGEVHCHEVRLDDEWILAGPVENVMQQGVGARTGGLQTSTLAVGLTDAALHYLEDEATRRSDLSRPVDELRSVHRAVERDLLAMAEGAMVCTSEQLRVRAGSLVLRASQAALAAAKGTGYVVGHPAGRWCREALFFLVWSCPQGVTSAHLCELAGLE